MTESNYTSDHMGEGVWKKSSFSADGACVEVKISAETIFVRDSKQSGEGPQLSFNLREWNAFVAGVQHGEFSVID